MMRSHFLRLCGLGAFLLGALPLPGQSGNLANPGEVGQSVRAFPVDTNNIPVAPTAPEATLNPTPAAAPLQLAPLPAARQLPAAAKPLPVIVANNSADIFPAACFCLVTLAGFVAYYCGLTQARNCGHTCTLLLVCATFSILGFWAGGFAMESGGLGDVHALTPPAAGPLSSSMDQEVGFRAGGHYWGLMGSAGFFLAGDPEARGSMALLFLGQAVLVMVVVVAATGGALERARIMPMGIMSFLFSAVIYPLVANWFWGGGWLSRLGHEFNLGHGAVDLAGSGVIHLSAGTLALVLARDLGPRFGRFGRRGVAFPAHNLPLVMMGSSLLLPGLVGLNATFRLGVPTGDFDGGLAATNTLLAATTGLVTSYLLVVYRQGLVNPMRLCRGWLGGAIAAAASGAMLDSWAAAIIGVVAGWLAQATFEFLERQGIDDPVGAIAVHGTCGAWGLLALGLFADQSATGLGRVIPIRGLFFGGGVGQVEAQVIGLVVSFTMVFLLSRLAVHLIQRIVGLRVELEDETAGLDMPKLGVRGYEADVEPEMEP